MHNRLYQDRFLVQLLERSLLVPAVEVCSFEAIGNDVLLRTALGQLAERLNPAVYLRIYRSCIVNPAHIVGFKHWSQRVPFSHGQRLARHLLAQLQRRGVPQLLKRFAGAGQGVSGSVHPGIVPVGPDWRSIGSVCSLMHQPRAPRVVSAPNMTKPILFLLALTLGGVLTARAQHHAPAGAKPMAGMAGMKMDHAAAPGTPVAAFQHGMDSLMVVMDEGMRRMTGARPDDIDASFAAMMLPHHQGAVDMARLQLLYGQDPALRRLAQSIIAEQQVEIQQMAAWLKQHPVGAQNPGR